MWKEKATNKGVLKYRMPNIAEGYAFLALVDQLKVYSDVITVKGKFCAGMAPLLDYSALGYSSYDELLNDKVNMTIPMAEIVNELFDDITGAFAKKN